MKNKFQIDDNEIIKYLIEMMEKKLKDKYRCVNIFPIEGPHYRG